MDTSAGVIKLNKNGATIWEFVDSRIETNFSEPDITENLHEGVPETQDDSEEENSPCLSAGEVTTKKKKKRSKKKSNRSRAGTIVTSSEPVKIRKTVNWGTVEEILFKRDVAYDVVPNKGLYPLGLGGEEERFVENIDDFISKRQAELLERAQTLGIKLPVHDQSGSSTESRPFIETRQFDYRPGVNPIFHSLDESERIVLLHSITSSPVIDNMEGRLHHNQPLHPITELNKDIKQIRSSRESVGCSCKHIKVDKLSVIKMKSELTSHKDNLGLTKEMIENMSKSDLLNNLKEFMKTCLLCIESSCECYLAGVSCSAEVCGCLKHGYKPGQQQSCGNPNGLSIFNKENVHLYRIETISKYSTCTTSKKNA